MEVLGALGMRRRRCHCPRIQHRPSGAPPALPLGPFSEGQHFSNPKEDRPSGKRPRRPAASAEMRSPRHSPWVAHLDFVRNCHIDGRLTWGQSQRMARPVEEGAPASWRPRVPASQRLKQPYTPKIMNMKHTFNRPCPTAYQQRGNPTIFQPLQCRSRQFVGCDAHATRMHDV